MCVRPRVKVSCVTSSAAAELWRIMYAIRQMRSAWRLKSSAYGVMSPPFERFMSSWSLSSAEAARVLLAGVGAGPAAAGAGAAAALGSWADGDWGVLSVCSGVGTLTEVSELINPPMQTSGGVLRTHRLPGTRRQTPSV